MNADRSDDRLMTAKAPNGAPENQTPDAGPPTVETPPRRRMGPFDLPPVWLALFIAAAAGIDAALAYGAPETAARLAVDAPAVRWGGLALILLGLALAVWSAVHMLAHKTSVVPRQDPAVLVTTGPFRLSRNPIYLADLLILVGWGGWIGSIWPWLAAPMFAVLIERLFIRQEEAALAAAFPEEFAAWSSRVRRWI